MWNPMGPNKPVVRPAVVDYPGANAVDGVVWSRWGPDEAVGRGKTGVCYTGCGPGSTGPQRTKVLPATVTLRDPVDTSDGWLFHLITITIEGEKPFTNTLLTPSVTTGHGAA